MSLSSLLAQGKKRRGLKYLLDEARSSFPAKWRAAGVPDDVIDDWIKGHPASDRSRLTGWAQRWARWIWQGQDARKWYTGKFWEGELSESNGPMGYLVAVRGPFDGKRTERGTYGTTAWRQHAKKPASFWKPKILSMMRSDDEPRTFNQIMLDLSNTTGDMGMGTPAEVALWELVQERQLAHTLPAKGARDQLAVYFVPLYGKSGAYPWELGWGA